jgi:hypothetical protein
MATGGIFTIITNDGKQDRMLMATELLSERLRSIQVERTANNRVLYGNIPSDDVRNLPTLLDIEKTHILFTNAHFKPFAALGFEYNKVTPSSGTTALGSTIQFSIPQFGDFFHDIAFHVVLTQPTLTVDGGTASGNAPSMRWCSWPGERLLKKVTQEVNGNPLDTYETHATVAHREYRVAPNKLTAWKRCVGQEEALDANVRQPDWAGNNLAAPTHRVLGQVALGNQTPTAQKTGSLEMFVPLLFWYNKDVRLAVPSVAIPYGQRFINLELANQNELVGLVPRGTGTWASPNGSLGTVSVSKAELYINNIFMNPEVHKIYIQRVGFSLIRVHRMQVFTVNNASDNLLLQNLKWPIEYMFVGCKVKDYYSPSSNALMAQNLDCWDKYSWYAQKQLRTSGYSVGAKQKVVTSAVTSIHINEADGVVALTGGSFVGLYGLNFPTETGVTGTSTGVGGQGQTQTAGSIPAGTVLEINGMRFTLTASVAAAATSATVTPTPNVDITYAGSEVYAVLDEGLELQAKQWTSTVSTLSLSAHGVDIYKEFPSQFFNAYTAYHYGGPNVNAPQDVGSMFVPFCLYPGTYQPSGHINVSRAREFYVKYASDVISSTVNGLLVVVASAINFLLITDGSAVLRYST